MGARAAGHGRSWGCFMRTLDVAALCAIIISSATIGAAEGALVCRFSTVEDTAGRTALSGTVARMNGGAIIEYDGDRLCCTNRLTAKVPLSKDGLIPRLQ